MTDNELDEAIRAARLPNMRKAFAGESLTAEDIEDEQAALDVVFSIGQDDFDPPDVRGLGYEPLSEQWICDAHGVGGCKQTPECAALPWEVADTDPRLRPFVVWAMDQFAKVIRPYDQARAHDEDVEMPDEAFDAYWPGDWVAAEALRQRQTRGGSNGRD